MLFKGFLLSKKGRGKRFVTAAIVLLTLPGLLNLAYSSSAAAAGKKDVVLPGAPANDRVKLGKARVHQPARNRATYPKFDPTARRALPKAGTATVTVGRSGLAKLRGARSGSRT